MVHKGRLTGRKPGMGGKGPVRPMLGGPMGPVRPNPISMPPSGPSPIRAQGDQFGAALQAGRFGAAMGAIGGGGSPSPASGAGKLIPGARGKGNPLKTRF